MELKLAAQLYTLREYLKNEEDIRTTLKKVKDIGYDYVQLSGIAPIDAAVLKKILDDNKLQPIITHLPFERLINEYDTVVKDHHTLNCPNVAIGVAPIEYRNKCGYYEFAKIASDVADKLKKDDLTFSYHNHAFEFKKYDGKTGFEIMFENSSENFLAEIDTFWVTFGGGSPAYWIEKLGKRIVVLHYKDMVIGENDEQLMAEVGEGNLDWQGIIKATKDANIEFAAVEQDDCYEKSPFDSLKTSLENLKKMI